jgi:hypothetical protein
MLLFTDASKVLPDEETLTVILTTHSNPNQDKKKISGER